MGILVNLDNGGTFTDVCISDGRRIAHAKSPTTPHDLTQCFVDALKRGASELYGEDDLARLIRETECLRYSTTSGTNAVVEHKGTPVTLLVAAGEEETLYGATRLVSGSGLWQAMVPKQPSGIVIGDSGHIDADGLTRTINALLADGAQRLAVCLPNVATEQQVKDVLLERYPRHLLGAIPFLISTELVADVDDARRTVTAVINSYLHPAMEHFLYSAENICKSQHLKRPLLIFRNDGNSARVAKTTALKTWGSGPRGGIEGALAYARLYDLPTVVAMDIGGTTTDLTVITGANTALQAHGKVNDLPISFPLPKLQSFGLGGSSIVRVKGQAITIGPESVGAVPGPACFARGGSEATLTDALLITGVLDASKYLGGELSLDLARARQAVETAVATPLGTSIEAAAAAIVAAFQKQVGERLSAALDAAGAELATTTLLAYGGGGPVIVSGIAHAVGIKRVMIPQLASVFSAFGIGFSHLAHEYSVPLASLSGGLAAAQQELRARARRDMYGEGVDPDACEYEYSLWRVRGEELEQQALASDTPPAGADGAHDHVNLKATYALPISELAPDVAVCGELARQEAIEVRLAGSAATIPVIDDQALLPGHGTEGPCLIKGDYLTCVIEPGWKARVTGNGDLMLEVK